jgi:hypothetical protein
LLRFMAGHRLARRDGPNLQKGCDCSR